MFAAYNRNGIAATIHHASAATLPKADAAALRELFDDALVPGAGPHNMDCPPKMMTLITSDCGATRSLSIKWP